MNLHAGKSTWLNFHAVASPRSVRLISFSVVIGVALLSAGSLPLSAQPTLGTEKYVTRLQPMLERIILEESIVGLAIGIVEDGAVTYSAGFGVTTLREPARPVSA